MRWRKRILVSTISFYQIFDKGHIKDSEGRSVDFKNTIIIMTSNAADQAICDACDEAESQLDNSTLLEMIRPDLQRYFKPAFFGPYDNCALLPT